MAQYQNFHWTAKTMGTDYYPEHWDRKLWSSDLDRMLETGITCIRIAEFAWNKVEPQEGEFTFEFFDEFLDLCDKKGMEVIFGTPSATPPAWLTEKYPEVLNCRVDGSRIYHGGRRQYNYNSPKYRELVARIVEKEAEHYAKHPAIVGWQLDNELNCECDVFYSESDSAAFRIFLKEKYRTLEALNEAWGTNFWNQTYTDWSQIYVPRQVLNNGRNPHQHLDYLRFVSASCISFAQMQTDIIRRYTKPGDFITTNGKFGHLDNHKLEKEALDVYTYDSYPNFAQAVGPDAKNFDSGLKDRGWSRNLAEVRSICPHFGIMEQQSGPGGWTTRMEQASPRPGQLTLWAMQSVAHGADFIGFFRWRTATYGTEIYWHGILNYDNRDNRRLAEVKDFYQKLHSLDPAAGAAYQAAFAVVKDYDNEYDSEIDRWHGNVAWPSELGIFMASQYDHTPCDYFYINDETRAEDLAVYPVLFYPHPVILSEKRTEVLKQYVASGGLLVIGCRAGYKDMEGHCVMMPMPGLLSELTGTDIGDFTFTCPGEDTVTMQLEGETASGFNKVVYEAPVFNDILTSHENTKVLARYTNNYFAGEPALTEHPYGKGRVLHLGTTFTRENTGMLLRYLKIQEPFANYIKAPEEVELAMQENKGRRFLFVLNYAKHENTITLMAPLKLMYTGETQREGTVTLPAYGTAVYEI